MKTALYAILAVAVVGGMGVSPAFAQSASAEEIAQAILGAELLNNFQQATALQTQTLQFGVVFGWILSGIGLFAGIVVLIIVASRWVTGSSINQARGLDNLFKFGKQNKVDDE